MSRTIVMHRRLRVSQQPHHGTWVECRSTEARDLRGKIARHWQGVTCKRCLATRKP